jgi:hypothetical protein
LTTLIECSDQIVYTGGLLWLFLLCKHHHHHHPFNC